jgi:hypothetical protein
LGKITIDLGDGDTYATCDCCGQRAPSVVGFVYEDGNAFAVYYAGWTEGHRRIISLTIGIGDWSDEATPQDRRSFGLQSWVDDSSINFEVLEPTDSRYGQNTFLGAMLSRSAALSDPEIGSVFHVAEHIVADDPRVREALATTTG